jgi:hypothetical protein
LETLLKVMMLNLTSALVLLAPHDVQMIAVPILRRYGGEELVRLPPHIPLQAPFVALEQLPAACEKLAEICASIKPFEITLSGYHRLSGATALRVVNPEPIQALKRQISEAFPDANGTGGYLPSLVVARFSSEAEQRSALLPEYVAITFRVYRLHVVYGPEQITLPWLPYEVLSFGVS